MTIPRRTFIQSVAAMLGVAGVPVVAKPITFRGQPIVAVPTLGGVAFTLPIDTPGVRWRIWNTNWTEWNDKGEVVQSIKIR